jgi:hypothetical protein
METLIPHEPLHWRRAVSVVLGAALIAGCTFPGKENPEAPATPDVGISHSAAPSTSPATPRSLQEFAGDPVPKDWVEAVRASTVKLIGLGNQCTGFIVNQLVITAGHCFEGKESGPIKIYRSNDREVGELASWKYYNGKISSTDDGVYDIGVGRPRASIPGTYLVRDTIPHNALRPGETFTTTGYPNGIQAPLTGTVVYAGAASSSQNFFILNTRQSRAMRDNFCEGGASGSPVISPHGDIGVLSWHAGDPEAAVEEISRTQNVNLKAAGVDRVCGATMLKPDVFAALAG